MSLPTLPKVQKLQEALHVKAKRSSDYRFYTLYDKMYRADVLWVAYRRCLINGGAPGINGQTFEDIEDYGEKRWLDELAEELRTKTYRPSPVRRVWIPKPDGKQRPLGIPTIKDRVVQMAAVLLLEPIFEADLQPEQYAYRPGKSAHDAIRHVHLLLNTGHTEVIDADLSGYFDSIPHGELMKSVARRISDKQMLHLIKMWLVAPVEEIDERGRKHRTTRNKDEKRGCPQGAPISPLLANLYMRRFVLGWKVLGHEHRLDAHIVNYADDFVICCRGTGEEAMTAMRQIMRKLKLTVNETKTRRCRVPVESFDFLGYTIGRCYSSKMGKAYIGTRPSKKKVKSLCREISELTSRRWTLLPVEDRVARINRKLIGWSNYFCLGPVSKAYKSVDRHVCRRLRQWLCAKHKVEGQGTSRFPDEHLYDVLHLTRLELRTRNFSWANT
ncbi:MAG: group II intron reverse transcriptase/maturase [Planctomycetes bacterium]|nr:group II intron reverse transcriptase/maturase [Planctomycetota bacterium]